MGEQVRSEEPDPTLWKIRLADLLQQAYDTDREELFPEMANLSFIYADLLQGALNEVDWIEIAEDYLKEFGEAGGGGEKKGFPPPPKPPTT